MAADPGPGPPESWRTRPLMLRMACGAEAGKQVGYNSPESAFPIETDTFSGRMYFRFKGMAHEPTEYFAGKNRQLSAVVQGRVKRPIPMHDTFTGYEFDRPFQNVPVRAPLSSLSLSLVFFYSGKRGPALLACPACATLEVSCSSTERAPWPHALLRATGEEHAPGCLRSTPMAVCGLMLASLVLASLSLSLIEPLS